MSLEPERNLAQLDRERIQVHAVDAFANHFANRCAKRDGGRLLFAGTDDGEFGGNSAGRGQQDMAGAAGDIGDAQAQEGLGGE